MKRSLLKLIIPGIALSLFLLSIHALRQELHGYTLADVYSEFLHVGWRETCLALLATTLSYVSAVGYDLIALRLAGKVLPFHRIGLASFVATAFSNALGLSVVSGGSIRLRLYSLWGLSAVEIARIVALCGILFGLGLLSISGLVILIEPLRLPPDYHWPILTDRPLGVLVLIPVMAYIAWSCWGRHPFRIHAFEFSPPAPRQVGVHLLTAAGDWLFSGTTLFFLLPYSRDLTYPGFLGVFFLAALLAHVSAVPGGVGVFEYLMVKLLAPSYEPHTVLSALITYRIIFCLVPFLLAGCVLLSHEIHLRRRQVIPAGKRVLDWATQFTPDFFAVSTFLAGVVLLYSGAVPPVQGRLEILERLLPLGALEISHLLGSITGLLLLFLARGIQRRLDAAWWLTSVLLGAGILASLTKGIDYEEATILSIQLLALLLSHQAFYRRSSLFTVTFSVRWIALIGAAMACSFVAGLFAYKHVEYQDSLWWTFSLQGDAPRFLRASLSILVTGLAVSTGLLLRAHPMQPPSATPEGLKRAREVIARSESPLAHLAWLGDKALLFSASGKSFLMYGSTPSTWVALGDPVGLEEEAEELIWTFREAAEREGARVLFYEVSAEQLPLYLGLGLTPLKVGEEGIVSLSDFSLEGKAHTKLRHIVRKIEGLGFTFEVVPAGVVHDLLAGMREVSQDWLSAKNAKEKGFSLGAFKEDYLVHFPTAVVRDMGGKMVAFANILECAGKQVLTIDLMRHTHDAPNGLMDYLFTRLLLWGHEQGFETFSLGMAPLSGLSAHAHAGLWNRMGAWVYNHGEHFYNFEGLRAYKEKFNPDWKPRYIVTSTLLSLPAALTDVVTLISGGLTGVFKR